MTDHRRTAAAATFVLLLLGVAAAMPSAQAQTHPLSSREERVQIDSGPLRNDGSSAMLVWSEVIEIPGAQWLRLQFDMALLAEDPKTGESSTLRIVSLTDGALQTLDAESMHQWHRTSAYFNGDIVALELIAAPNDRLNRIVLDWVTAGEPEPTSTSICGGADDRVLSTDPRAGRSLPVGCTAWLIDDNNGCFLSAGHCADRTDVIEFNVPLSDAFGRIQHPPPDDQYIVDPLSIQFVSSGLGNDWAYFGCHPNSNTGLTPAQAQGQTFLLADSAPPVSNQNLRVTGYGVVSSPIPREWNQAQKTHAGPYASIFESTLRYQTDTTGGDSGSPIIDDTMGLAIGVHTNGGCDVTGVNAGTGINSQALQAALEDPQGVCGPNLEFDLPAGAPVAAKPAGGTTIRVVVRGVHGHTAQPGTGLLHYDVGSGEQIVPMTMVASNAYDAALPALPCGAPIRYSFSAQTASGETVQDPRGGLAESYLALGGAASELVFDDDFEQDRGWAVQDENLLGGTWERGDPRGGGLRGDPLDDFDGFGQCYVTQNLAGNSDVDGGPTRLLSPPIDTGGRDAVVRYAVWFTNDDFDQDSMVVEVSNDDGRSWTLVETIRGRRLWRRTHFRLAEYVVPSAQVRLRFSVADQPNDSVTEAGVDAVEVHAIRTEPSATSVVPDHGSFRGGNLVTITGEGFTPRTRVLFGNTPATAVAFVDSNTLRVVAPPMTVPPATGPLQGNAKAGGLAQTVDVVVADRCGSGTLEAAYTYHAKR